MPIKPFNAAALLRALNAAPAAADIGSTKMNCREFAADRPHTPLRKPKPVVFIVDDDVSVRESLELLIRRAGWQPIAFALAQEFVSYPPVCSPNCLILDVGLPDINGLDLQRQISGQYQSPVIFLTGYGDVPTSVRALKAGAFDFLTKPFRPQELRDLVQDALARDCERRDRQTALDSLQRRFESLTPREREVLPLVVSGLLNKQAAAHLGISEITLQIHRAKVMRKMKAQSLVGLVRMADALDVSLATVRRPARPAVGLGHATAELGLAQVQCRLNQLAWMDGAT